MKEFAGVSKSVKQVEEWAIQDHQAATRAAEFVVRKIKDCADVVHEKGVDLGAAQGASSSFSREDWVVHTEVGRLISELGERQAEKRRTEADLKQIGAFRAACGLLRQPVLRVELASQVANQLNLKTHLKSRIIASASALQVKAVAAAVRDIKDGWNGYLKEYNTNAWNGCRLLGRPRRAQEVA